LIVVARELESVRVELSDAVNVPPRGVSSLIEPLYWLVSWIVVVPVVSSQEYEALSLWPGV
jgi:hypothetical protein